MRLGPYPRLVVGRATRTRKEIWAGSTSAPRWRMSPGLEILLIVWGVLTGVLIILLIYRGTLTMQEDDQLFLEESESHMAQEQMELMAKVNKINPLVKILGATSGLMFLVIAGLFIYQGLNQVQ
jgi:uncharacterized membrane protein SpoIIM required for sporulation